MKIFRAARAIWLTVVCVALTVGFFFLKSHATSLNITKSGERVVLS